MTRNEVIELLMRRDSISFEEAYQYVMECANHITELFNENYKLPPYQLYEYATEIIADELGLEPDYLDAVLNV